MAVDRKVVEAKIDEVLSANNKKQAAATKSDPFTSGGMPNMGADNPFAAFGAMGGMPDMAAMQGGKLPLKMRLMAKLAQLATNPKFARFLQKKWWPLWVLVGILLSGFLVIGALLFLLYKMVMGIVSAYTDLFKRS